MVNNFTNRVYINILYYLVNMQIILFIDIYSYLLYCLNILYINIIFIRIIRVYKKYKYISLINIIFIFIK